MSSRVFLTSYGGGHAQILAALVPALRAQGFATDVIGLTTAYALLRRQGIEVQSVEALLESDNDRHWLDSAEEFLNGPGHPDVTRDQTRAYFALGIRDLALELGEADALDQVRRRGRMAFCPVDAFRRYFRKTRPDIVVGTTSPRFELAAQKAAYAEGVSSLAIGDLFIEHERAWILQPDYGDRLAVLSEQVAQSIVADSFAADRVRVTGNPAFDSLAPNARDAPRRADLRARFDIGDRRLILCPTSSTARAKNGQLFLEPAAFARRMEAFCRSRDDLVYMMRAHPNAPFQMPDECISGLNPDSSSMDVDDAILMADLVLVESSTVGLQAALKGKPVICVGFVDYAVYPRYGMAHVADTLDDALTRIDHVAALPLKAMGIPALGTATDNVIQFIHDILREGPRLRPAGT